MNNGIPRVLVPAGAGFLMFVIVVAAGWSRYSNEKRVYVVFPARHHLTNVLEMAETIRTLTGSYPSSLDDLLEKAKGLGRDVKRIVQPPEEGSFVFEISDGRPRATWLVPPEIMKDHFLPERLTEPDEAAEHLPLVPFSAFAESKHFPRCVLLAAATAIATGGLWFLGVCRSRARTRTDAVVTALQAIFLTVVALVAAMVIMEFHVFPHH
jgi:hypothetical protein